MLYLLVIGYFDQPFLIVTRMQVRPVSCAKVPPFPLRGFVSQKSEMKKNYNHGNNPTAILKIH